MTRMITVIAPPDDVTWNGLDLHTYRSKFIPNQEPEIPKASHNMNIQNVDQIQSAIGSAGQQHDLSSTCKKSGSEHKAE